MAERRFICKDCSGSGKIELGPCKVCEGCGFVYDPEMVRPAPR